MRKSDRSQINEINVVPYVDVMLVLLVVFMVTAPLLVQGIKIDCLEEISFLKKWINKDKIKENVKFYGNCEYSSYLKSIIN